MSLDRAELVRTRTELAANLDLTGLTREQVAADLGYDATRLSAALEPDGSGDPVDVWQLRDYLDQAVRDAGATPVPFTVLTERSRVMAGTWFRLRPAPRHDFTVV